MVSTTWCSGLSSLLWKNLLLKRRHWVATLLEVLFPLVIVTLLTVIKRVVPSVKVPAGWSTSDHSTGSAKSFGSSFNFFDPNGDADASVFFTPQNVPKFVFPELSLSGLLLALAMRSLQHGIQMGQLSPLQLQICQHRMLFEAATSVDPASPLAVPKECDGRVMPYKLAIVPDNSFTREYFFATIKSWYPPMQLVNVSSFYSFNDGTIDTNGFVMPSLEQSVKFFESNDALNAYVKDSNYGLDLDHTRIFGAIVFNEFPQEQAIGTFQSIDYSLRLNATWTDDFATNDVPRTEGDPLAYQAFQRKIDTTFISRYALNGFMTLQTLVTRFVTCMPQWDANTKSTTGECQRPQSTAKATLQVTRKLREALDGDLVLKYALEQYVQAVSPKAVASSGAVNLSSVVSPEIEQLLLRPLYQAPQPIGQAFVAPFPIDTFTSSSFYDYVKDLFSLDIVTCYIMIVARMLVVFIKEKETRMREFMKIVGVKENTIVLSWYVIYAAIFAMIAGLQTVIGCFGLFESSHVVLIFLFFYLFGLASLAFCYCVSAMFSKARTGAFAGVVLYFIMNSISSSIKLQTSEGSKIVASVLPPLAVGFGAQVLSELESNSIGVTFDNWTANVVNIRFINVLAMLAFDFVMYTLLGCYLERVIPKDYGTTLPWYFPLQSSFWCKSRRYYGKVDAVIHTDVESDLALDVNPNVEQVSEELIMQEQRGEALRIQRLRKVFNLDHGEKVAVKNMNLTMYKNQITCLLGHNGAGKTTLISMLTGMTPVSSGDAHFQGLSITEDMDGIRESLGICFQHDALYPELTVEEHLLFFARLKGYRNKALREVVSKQIQEVGLTEKRHTRSTALSGGMKRKLSVAIALLGDSSLVFLDEPTSGMDPYSRRSTWEILMNNRHGRVMVLTTHFMDEADILGDRIAIMAEGELRCCGSSLFLKNRFGAGYTLTLVKSDSSESASADGYVINLIKSYVPRAQILSNVGAELAFQLPLDTSKHFAAMFSELDTKLEQFGISSYGVSVTTLEEVFIKVAELADDEYETHQHRMAPKQLQASDAAEHLRNGTPVHSPDSAPSAVPERVVPPLTGFRGFGNQLQALLLKRFHFARRDRKMFLYGVGLPMLLMVLSFSICYSNSMLKSDPLLVLNTAINDLPGGASDTSTLFVCHENQGNWCSEVMAKHFSGSTVSPLVLSAPYFGSDSPTVFDVTYTDPIVDANGTTGASLAAGEQLYQRGYKTSIKNQFGAYVVQSSSATNTFGYNLLVNTTSMHSPVIFKTLLDQALYRFFADMNDSNSPHSTGKDALDLIVNTHPLPYTKTSKAVLGSFMSLFACFFIVIAFCYFPVAIAVFIVKEKESSQNAKHQQLVSGVSLVAFWLANYIWDLVTYALVAGVAIGLIEFYQVQALTGKGCITCTSSTFPAVILLFVLFGLAIIPYTYCLTYLFQEHASSQTYTVVLNFLFGLILLLISHNLAAFDSTKQVNDVLIFIFRLSPLFNLGNGVLTLSFTEYKSNFDPSKKDPFGADQIGYELLFLGCTSILYSAMAVGIDFALTFSCVRNVLGCYKRRKWAKVDDQPSDQQDAPVDQDVRREAHRVAGTSTSYRDGDDLLQLRKLRKVYDSGKIAVHELCFGLKQGECFGFLGINGAGKTTTMRMLTGDEVPTSGSARIADFDILSEQMHIRQLIGYCPQFDALFELLTVREHLQLFGRIKGMAGNELDRVVQHKLQQLNLQDFEHKLAGSLSGGNKRKLSVAIALIGNPRIAFLDEPSTGMDPVSRRFMWNVIAQISTQSRNSTVLLTTHSMEEAEALCSRVGIMVSGRLRCLGSVQHLKSRFGDGFVLDVKLGDVFDKAKLHSMVQSNRLGDMIQRDHLAHACAQLGDSNFASRIADKHPTGHLLHAALERDGTIRSVVLCSWFVAEQRFEKLWAYLKQSFGAHVNVSVLERQNDVCRFKLATCATSGVNQRTAVVPVLRISKVFAIVEQMKNQLAIHEYSVCQTTLEQIFNAFASQQREEPRVARGIMP